MNCACAHDAVGNLSNRVENAFTSFFNVNNLNELTTVGRSGTFTVAGGVQGSPSSVTVNGSSATVCGDATFAKDGFSIGQLTSATGKESGGTTNRLHEQFGYDYDAAGNLNWRTNNALVQQFSVNNLNELTTVGRSGTFTVAGGPGRVCRSAAVARALEIPERRLSANIDPDLLGRFDESTY